MLNLSRLNPEQRRAVTTTEGPLLVVAGPGSGKTAVIAARVAYLIDARAADPSAVLAVTFTNRAGRELRRRVAETVDERAAGVWAGTFHAFALQLLRRWGGHFGFDPRHLSVYADSDDRRAALRQAVHDLGRTFAGERPETILRAIGRAKERLLGPADTAAGDPDLGAVYAAYQAVLARRNALDFDDFLLFAVRLLEERPEVLAELQGTYRYLLVDEFQDVGPAQHRLLTLLAAGHHNLCVVGDPLQNLFAWRGSDIRYLLEFGRAYPDAQVITLTQSYRATGTLLAVANALGTLLRYGRRQLWTANPPGMQVIVKHAANPQGEAIFVAAEVQRLLEEGAVQSPAGCAVLYRTNGQARELELACLAAGLPYRTRGDGTALGRAEVRVVLAYLRLIHNPRDTAALGRVINTPPRRLASLERRIRAGEELTLDSLAETFPCGTAGAAARQALQHFLDTLASLCGLRNGPPAALIEAVLDRTGYRSWLVRQDDGEQRLAHVEALRVLAERSEAPNLAEFLDAVSLATDVERDAGTDRLTLSTIHAAKGLEWPVVFVVGVEEGLLPHVRALDQRGNGPGGEAIEEELRLCYVAVTRARERLYLTAARRRTGAGGTATVSPSRFLGCLPAALVSAPAACGAAH